jgi:hypothetical protein
LQLGHRAPQRAGVEVPLSRCLRQVNSSEE